jgi:hypothetical protein
VGGCGHPGRQSPRGGKINILNEKIRLFALKNFKLLINTNRKFNK